MNAGAYEFFKDFGVPLITVGVIPTIFFIVKNLHELGMSIVELQGKNERVTESLYHIENNYKQGIEGLNHEVNEMKTDIKELLKLAYGRRKGDEPI